MLHDQLKEIDGSLSAVVLELAEINATLRKIMKVVTLRVTEGGQNVDQNEQ